MDKEEPEQKPKRSLFDYVINIICILVLLWFGIGEASHLYRTPESIEKVKSSYTREYSLSTTFPFIGSYFLMKPVDYEPDSSYPLIIALHGVSNRIYAAEALSTDLFRKHLKVFVMVPIAPERAFWATPKNKQFRMKRNIPYPDHLPQVLAGIENIKSRYSINNDKVYIVGHSMGGSGVLGALQRYPDTFAAGIASAGSWDSAETGSIKAPVWIIHGTDDGAVPFEIGQKLATVLDQKQKPVKFSPLVGEGHAIGPQVYSNPKVWQWLLSQ